jgi:hypothetical protein
VRVLLDCGCTIDDEYKSTVHDVSDQRSAGDIERKKHHYPLEGAAAGYCLTHDMYRPCPCDRRPMPMV